MSITTKERDLYSTVWQSVDTYGQYSPGEKYLPLFLHMIGDRRAPRHGDPAYPRSVLDAGCGSGKGALALQAAGFHVSMSDVTREGLIPEASGIHFHEHVLWRPFYGWETPVQYDFVYCCDVLEHIPPQFTMISVRELLQIAPIVFVAVCNVPDSSGSWVGQALHQTVQPFTWWRDSFREIATVLDARDLHDNSVFLLERSNVERA